MAWSSAQAVVPATDPVSAASEIFKDWRFESLFRRIDPSIRGQIPERAFYDYFQAMASRLGRVRRVEKKWLNESGGNEVHVINEVLFDRGPAKVILSLVRRDGSWYLKEMVIESELLEDFGAQAASARGERRFHEWSTSVSAADEEQKFKTTKLTMELDLAAALELYKIDNAQYPATSEGLRALIERPAAAKGWQGPYLDEYEMLDAWGHEFVYRSPGVRHPAGFDLYSKGADGRGDGNQADDIVL
jgi:type II secretion system protein G